MLLTETALTLDGIHDGYSLKTFKVLGGKNINWQRFMLVNIVKNFLTPPRSSDTKNVLIKTVDFSKPGNPVIIRRGDLRPCGSQRYCEVIQEKDWMRSGGGMIGTKRNGFINPNFQAYNIGQFRMLEHQSSRSFIQ